MMRAWRRIAAPLREAARSWRARASRRSKARPTDSFGTAALGANFLADRWGAQIIDLSDPEGALSAGAVPQSGEPDSATAPWLAAEYCQLKDGGVTQSVRTWMDRSPVGLVAVTGQPDDPEQGLGGHLQERGLNVAHTGITRGKDLSTCVHIAVLEQTGHVYPATPDDFRVVAFIPVYNEEDIIVPCVQRLIRQGVYVQIIDNWSTDSTPALLQQIADPHLLEVVRFPTDGPSDHFDLRGILGFVEDLQRRTSADWFVIHDADEVRAGPWKDLGLRESLYRADHMGFNAVDHTVLVFHPTDDEYAAGVDFGTYFRWFEFGDRPGHFRQVKAWKNLGIEIDLAGSGGHEVHFQGRRIYPYKFLLQHYPVRSQRHGEKKIFRDRKSRWSPEERGMGWHTHYDNIEPTHSFIRNSSDLLEFDDCFHESYLIERLTGMGLSDAP